MNTNKKRYLVYQTTNLVNGKIYIGKHVTSNIEDNYFGSGNLIRAAIKKYGLENFEFKILFELQNEEEMNLLEKSVVTEAFCARKDTYNINVGGDGGWSYINTQRELDPELKAKQLFNWVHNSKEYCHTNEFSNAISNGLKKCYKACPEKHGTTGKHWTSAIMSAKMQSLEFNRMKGSIWIFNVKTLECKIWPKNKEIPSGWLRGKKPKKPVKDPKHSSLLYCWISNGIESMYIQKTSLQHWLSIGWHQGRK